MTYKKRNLKFEFTLKEGLFEEPDRNTLTIENIKAELQVGAYGGISGTQLEARVFGLSLESMALLSYKGLQLNGAKQNLIRVWANDEPIFYGSITNCFADLNQMPDAPLIISATATGFDQSRKASTFTSEGSVAVVDIIKAIAGEINYSVVNSGVDAVVENPYFQGNPIEQIHQVAELAKINMDIRNMNIFIWPKDGNVDQVVPFVSPEHGLIGYPVFSNWGISFQCQYSPLIIRGRDVQLETTLPNGSGTYTVQTGIHHLSSWIEGGPWVTQVWASIGKAAGEST